MTTRYYVEIYEISTGKVEKRREKNSRYGAEKLYDIIVNNQRLNDLYDIRIIEDVIMEEEAYW